MFSAVPWSILFFCPMVTLIILEIELNLVTIIYCSKNHYVKLGNHTILSDVYWTSKSYFLYEKCFLSGLLNHWKPFDSPYYKIWNTLWKSFNYSRLTKNKFPPEVFSTFCNQVYSPWSWNMSHIIIFIEKIHRRYGPTFVVSFCWYAHRCYKASLLVHEFMWTPVPRLHKTLTSNWCITNSHLRPWFFRKIRAFTL